ncbi:Annexin [Aspergillus avenaceus]|uniref:Annexin n=1 Tax=Aspergillus avenaceus TaxID=36643 RepID=A0A5N6TW09_ASPAV|nr:Annexin [Aspergillus avenaceus]
MATATPGPRTPGHNDPFTDNSAVTENGTSVPKDQRRNSSLGFLRRSKSTEPLGDRKLSGSKSKKNPKAQVMDEELRRQQESMPKHAPRLPDLSPAPILESFGGEGNHENVAAPSVNASSLQQQHSSRNSMSTEYDPYARTESMTHRGRYSYASSAVSAVNNPRRLRRRKDPTPYNVLVIGARNSGKTSFLNFLRNSLAMPSHKHPSRPVEEMEYQGRHSSANQGYTSHYLETEIDGERVGLTLWDSQGFDRNIVDIQLRGVTGFLESKFEETLSEEMKVIRSPGVRDTHIHCTFLLLDPVRLDQNIAAAEQAAQGNLKVSDSPVIGVLDESMDLQVLRAVLGKTTVVPVISKADTITAAHMSYLKKAVWDSLKKANIDPLEILTLEDQEEYTSSESADEDDDSEGAEDAQNSVPSSPSSRSQGSATQSPPPIVPFSTLSPDPHSLAAGEEPVGRKFPWGFADPYDPEHCDFVKLKESVFSDWRTELREASRVVWYERWRTSRLNRKTPISAASTPSKKVDDPRSRGRSKSPGGRSRHRSRSRVSTGPGTHLLSEPADEYLRPRSRSRGASPLRVYGNGSRHRPSKSDTDRDAYLRAERDRDHLYHSDTGESKGPKRDKRDYTRSPNLRPSRYDVPSDDEYLNSDDEALAYGDIPGGLERGYYGYTSSPRSSSSRVGNTMMTGALNGDARSRHGRSRDSDGFNQAEPGSHPSYARPDPFKYATPRNYPPTQPGRTGPSTSTNEWAPIPECERPGFVPPSSQAEREYIPGAFPQPGRTQSERPVTSGAPTFSVPQYMNLEAHSNPYAAWSGLPISMPTGHAYASSVNPPAYDRPPPSDTNVQTPYANLPAFQYAQIDPKVKYGSKGSSAKPVAYSAAPQYSKRSDANKNEPGKYTNISYSAAPQFSLKIPTGRAESEQQYVEIKPAERPVTRPASDSVSSGNNLSVGTLDPGFRPASPMLEPYKGTYQSISPMPSPMFVPSKRDDDVSDVEPLDTGSDTSGHKKNRRKKSKDSKELKEPKDDRSKRDSSRVRHEQEESQEQALVLISPSATKKKVTFYDPEPDVIAMKDAMSHIRGVDNKVFIRVLPNLTGDEVLDLRAEYKKHVKVHGKGINLAKHIRSKLGNSAFGKVCYATAMGRWESEAFWANCYYQASTSRRELLIESLFGRSNSEIRAIKECFRDSRYQHSLEKCMKTELKADKFRTAVLLALEETRQSEREPIDPIMVERDVHELHKALMSRHGGETAMIYIIVRRSDSHLWEVLQAYEEIYRQNFARAMIAKSQNLVGETLAHILNGVINRPMRDALLLHQALRESRSGKERSELLISRLVRLHWEPRHLERVKSEFRRRYGERLEEAIAEEVLPTNGGSEWGEFCIELARSSKALSKRV